MESAGDLIGSAVELSTCVEVTECNLKGRDPLCWMDVYRDASTVVLNGDVVSLVYCDLDGVAVSGHGLINGVVNNLIDQMVKSIRTC